MKKILILFVLAFIFYHVGFTQCSNFGSQYPSGTQSTTSNNLVTVSTCVYGGEWSAYNVTAGETYTWTTCGDSDFDTQITLWNTAHSISYAYNDDDCGLQSTITWTATFTGTVHVLVSRYNCSSQSTCMTLQWACITCGGGGGAPPTNCLGATTICSDNTFSGNSSGYGTQELNSSNEGCLWGENQSSWYFFQATAAGTIEFTISPQNGTDDYDFAIWGPYPSNSTPGGICPPSTTPIRCSWAAGGGNTGLGNGATDQSEGAGGNKWVAPINMNVGDVYILVIDNWSESNSPFDLDIDLSGGASLDCVPLPIDLMSFTGDATELGNELYWKTMAEINNDYFVIESSVDAGNFSPIGNIDGAGNSVQPIDYYFLDQDPIAGVTYYRLKQVDFDGKFSYSDIVAVKRLSAGEIVLTPNPVKDILNIEINVTEGGLYSFALTDLLGSTIQKDVALSKGNNQIKWDVFKELAQGFYVLKIIDNNGALISTNKLVKN